MKAERPQVESVLAAVQEAGSLARTMQSRISLSVKPDGTVVTETDISSHNLLCKALARLTPRIPVISEEQPIEDNQKIMGEPLFWAIDPLDVTANYAAGGNAYSINVALVEDGIPVLGVLYFPGMEELYYTDDQGRACKQHGKEPPRTIHVAPLNKGAAHTAAVRPHSQATHTPDSENTLKVIFTRGQRRACLVATGEATFCSERAGFRIWDSAATYAIITAAGGAIEQHNGAALRYNTSLELPSYFVGHPELLRHLHEVPHSQTGAPAGAQPSEPTLPPKRKQA